MNEQAVPGYTELKTLGAGGFGRVVLARHDPTETMVAIKYLRADLLGDPDFAALFRGEAEVLGSLSDPCVVRLYEYLEWPGGAAIVMELIDGTTVREILRRYGKTSPEAAIVVLYGSLLELAAAHARGVVHRDYKPENVLVNELGGSKLTDFGIAARSGTKPVSAGSLAYAPPEQFDGTPASPAGDVYAATATFYECLAGRPPFTGESSQALMYSTALLPCRSARCPSRCDRSSRSAWPRTRPTGPPTSPPWPPRSAPPLRRPTGPTGSSAGARSSARPPCCSPRCGRRAERLPRAASRSSRSGWPAATKEPGTGFSTRSSTSCSTGATRPPTSRRQPSTSSTSTMPCT
jgi:serine/threonine protein kinase